ncbi:MAG: type II toxin-antitoxin system VapC family toxin [Curvibacter sp.]|jgi:tRNA(fMet)-specific endonuclease VapC|nr:type II toxin-antitoxin system VapC family toxin [Curvibacter sp.]
MSGYMLDADTCAFILRRSSPVLLERIQAVPLQQQCVSVVTLAELLYGVQVSSRKKANRDAVDLLVRHVSVLEWTAEAANHYAEIRADLKKKGQQLGANDLMIAAHARSIDAVIVTNNVKDFRRVKGLKLENWM